MGHSNGGPARVPIEKRFWPKVDKSGDCWIWTGYRLPLGYGRFNVGGKHGPTRNAHAVAYELLVGPVPEGLELDHLCRIPSCVNPAHLEPVTHRENVLRGKSVAARHAVKTHCSRGHAYDEENTSVRWYAGGPHRECITCRRARVRERNRRAREVVRARLQRLAS